MTVYWLITLVVAEVFTDFSIMFWLLLIPLIYQDQYDVSLSKVIGKLMDITIAGRGL
jgi:hypothetical protein